MLSDMLLISLLLSNVFLLGSSRLGFHIKLLACQGAILGGIMLCDGSGGLHPEIVVLTFLIVILKAIVFPGLLLHAVNKTGISRELEPMVGFGFSLLAGAVSWGLALKLSSRLPIADSQALGLMIPAAFFTIFAGLFLIIFRRIAIMQIIGYLVTENGICIFGAAISHTQPLLVELAILLDVFAAVLLMTVILFQINRKIEDIHLDSSRLSALRD